MKKTIIAILASAFFVGGAFAQSPSASDSATDTQRDMKVEKHIRDLHAKLKITPVEETQWAAVASTMRDNVRDLDAAIDKRESIIDTASAVDNLNAYGDVAQAHADAVKKLSAAFAPLYTSMSDSQKMVADEVFAQRPHKDMKSPNAMQ